MASVVYNEFKRANAAGEIDLNADDIRCALLMTNTTADTENAGITTVAGFTTLDEYDGTGYTAGGVALTSEAVNKDDANNRAEFDAADVAFNSLTGNATRGVQGALIYKHVTTWPTDAIPIAFVEFDNQPLASNSTSISVPWNAEGILQLT